MKQRFCAVAISLFVLFAADAHAGEQRTIEDLFAADYRNQLVLDIEAAIALAQAEEGVIPKSAAREIQAKADISFAPIEEIEAEYKRVRHRMVALLNVWKGAMSAEAAGYVHFGVTTVDIYDTVRLLQIRDAISILINDMRDVESRLIALAEAHRDTPMIGRTLGQHALPITFGKKVAVWAAVNRRNIERLKEVLERVERLGVLKGAVGTHLGLGPRGVEIEKRVSASLGLSPPDPADWHGARDVFAEYALTLALISKSYAAIGGEVFRLQMTDIGEVFERRAATAVGSSAMPHKRNPSRSEALIHYGRTIPRLAAVLLDDMENAFERDNTSRPNRIVEDISIEAASMVADAMRLVTRLEVNPEQMRANLQKTDGMVAAQRLVLFLADELGRDEAEERVRNAAQTALEEGVSFRAALLTDVVLAPVLSDEIDKLLDVSTYLGLSAAQVDRTVRAIRRARKADDTGR